MISPGEEPSGFSTTEMLEGVGDAALTEEVGRNAFAFLSFLSAAHQPVAATAAFITTMKERPSPFPHRPSVSDCVIRHNLS